MRDIKRPVAEATYNRSEQYYECRGFSVCACMGPAVGEPYCPCSMGQAGLPLSVENVAALAQAEKDWQKFFDEGGFNNVQT